MFHYEDHVDREVDYTEADYDSLQERGKKF